MPEATMLCCDCSEWMRNGDLMPTRFESQKDALGVISNAKTEQNQENTIGLISMGGDGKADVLVNCTSDVGKVLSAADKMKIDGRADMLVALQTAQLALKHRKNKKQDQRIILFVGSPVESKEEKLLVKAGKRLKKNNVAVDIINFGEVEQNLSILESFLSAVNSNDNSHLVSVPPGGLISEAVVSSSIFYQQPVINEFAGLGDVNGGNNVINANVGGAPRNDLAEDPELAMAIRMSLEAERQRREVEAKQATDESLQTAQQQQQPSQQQNEPMNLDNNANSGAAEDEEDAELLRAMEMSMMNENNDEKADNTATKATTEDTKTNDQDKKAKQPSIDTMLNNETFMAELLSNLPGLTEDDININDLVGSADDKKNQGKNEDKKENNEDKNKDKDKDNKDKDEQSKH